MEKTLAEKIELLRTELRSCNDFNTKMLMWGTLAVNYCHEVAKTKVDRSFYAFQSEPVENPDVLLLGLNPKGKDPYSSMFNHEKDGWGLNNNGKMVPEVFIHQNPWYKGGKFVDKEWNILKRLKKTIEVNDDFRSRFDKMVYMNILYFSSDNFAEFKAISDTNWKEVYDNCIELTKLLIFEVIKPTRIVCLGPDTCFKQLIGKRPFETLIDYKLFKCEIEGHNVYGMTHPSYALKNIYREEIGRALYDDWLKS